MTRDDDPGRAGPVASQSDADGLDPLLVRAFGAAFDPNLPVDVEARHLWQLYRSARPSVIDGLAAAPDPGRLQRMLARVAITVVVTLMPSVLTAASADALPGDVLYGVKRHHQLEQVELAISWAERDAALVQLAELRLDEARAVVVSRPRTAARVVADAAAALEELERSPLSTGSLQARRMRDAAAREVASLLDDVPDSDRRHLQVAYEELSDDGPRMASASAPLGADEQRLATLDRGLASSSPDAVRSAAPGTPSPAADDRQLLARAPDDAPDAVSTQPTATPPPSRPSSAPAAVAAAALRPADPVPAATAPTPQQPAVVESETEDPPPPTDEPTSEPDTTPTVAPEPSSEPSDAENASRPSWALPRSPSPSATVDPEPTPAPSPELPPEPSTESSSEPSTEPSTAPAPTTSPSISAEPTASPAATSSPRPSEQPTTAAVRPEKGAAKAWKPGVAGRGPLAASVAPAAPEAP